MMWNLTLADDVELNPGPVRYPCTVCSRAVASHHRGIQCDRCDLWAHAVCCGVSAVEYGKLGMDEAGEWFCPSCSYQAGVARLPFANASLNSSANESALFGEGCESELNLDEQLFNARSNSIVYCHLNARSLLPKVDEIRNFAQKSKQNLILGISETWLTNSVVDGEVSLKGYTLYRKDRGIGWGGGILVYVPELLLSWRRPDLECEGVEAIWVELRFLKRKVLMCTVYRPLNSDHTVIERMCNMFEVACQEGTDLVISEDFNCNLLRPDSCTRELLTTAEVCNLRQLVKEPTRITSSSESLIDLLFVSHPDCFKHVGCMEVTDSDHLMVYGVFNEVVSAKSQCVKMVRSFKRCDRERLNSDLREVPWHVMDSFDTIDDMCNYWKALFLSVVDEHAPLVKMRMRQDSLQWITGEVRKLMKARNYFRKKFRRTQDPMEWDRFKRLR